ncbi:MAG: DUF3574 domain-containing protein [Synergistaceae bacterium]|nr:DUF3574 domain-containing protein [Synergistaceae bacterium]
MKNKPLLVLYVIVVVMAGTLIFGEMDRGDIFGSESQTKYTMYVGLNDKDTNEQVFGHEEAKQAMFMIARKYTGGATFQEAQGYWYDKEADKVYTENTLVCIFLDTTPEIIKSIMDEALKVFNQTSILLETSEVRGAFYEGK